MKRLALLAGVALALCLGRPAFAQGVFADVPTDHWAYDAVNQLAASGVFTGYPDQTFGGKRALTRYEFAVAIQRMLQDITRKIEANKGSGTPGPAGERGSAGPAGPAGPRGEGANPEEMRRLRSDLDTLTKLVNEFRDTLAQLGTDVDQLKRDVAALNTRL